MFGERQSWPQLVGMPAAQAEAFIRAQNPQLNIVQLPEGSPTTRDYRLDRVRIFYGPNGFVSSAPQTG